MNCLFEVMSELEKVLCQVLMKSFQMLWYQAPKSIALGLAPCLLEGTREVAMMKMMPNKQRKVRSEAREQLQHLCTEFSGIPF